MNLEVFFKLEMLSSIKERILNNSIALFLEFVVVSDTLEIGVDVLSCYSIIMSLLMAEDYVFQGGYG